MLVIDASVLIGALTDGGAVGTALRSRLDGTANLRAPDLVNAETLSGLRSLLRQRDIDTAVYTQALAGLRRLGLRRMSTTPFIGRIAELRDNVSAYDATYVALAESLGCPLLTADTRLANAPGPRCDFEVI